MIISTRSGDNPLYSARRQMRRSGVRSAQADEAQTRVIFPPFRKWGQGGSRPMSAHAFHRRIGEDCDRTG